MAGETETSSALPDSATVDEAVKLMGDLVDNGSGKTDQPDSGNAGEEGDDAPAVGLSGDETDPTDGEEGADQEGDGEVEEMADTDSAPEFWSAEDKSAWEKIPAELRPTLKKYEQQRLEFVNEKAREAAAIRGRAAEEVKRANATVDQAAQWWQQAGPALAQAFADKWSQVNWTELAEKNPAEWARLNQIRIDEATTLAEANRRGQADIQAARQRQEQAFQETKHAEHMKLAAKLPDYFGTTEKATKTYDELGKFLFAKGIPIHRINTIHEAPIIEMALSAMRWEQAQKKISSATNPAANTTARATPTRVVPGPASRAGNRQSDAARQVGERFRKNGGTSIADAAELIRLNGL